MSQKNPQELQKMIEDLQRQVAELTGGATRNVNRIDMEIVPRLREQIDKLAKRVTELEKLVERNKPT